MKKDRKKYDSELRKYIYQYFYDYFQPILKNVFNAYPERNDREISNLIRREYGIPITNYQVYQYRTRFNIPNRAERIKKIEERKMNER